MRFNPIDIFPMRNPLDCTNIIKRFCKDKIVCDLGCGKADILEYLRINKLCSDVVGIELDEQKYGECIGAGRNYVKYGDITKEKIPDADVYIIWLGLNFPYDQLKDKLKKNSILINLDGLEKTNLKIQQDLNVKILEQGKYNYDETRFIPSMDIYLKQIKRIYGTWKVTGERHYYIYKV
jgi:hypothetical protein